MFGRLGSFKNFLGILMNLMNSTLLVKVIQSYQQPCPMNIQNELLELTNHFTPPPLVFIVFAKVTLFNIHPMQFILFEMGKKRPRDQSHCGKTWGKLNRFLFASLLRVV